MKSKPTTRFPDQDMNPKPPYCQSNAEPAELKATPVECVHVVVNFRFVYPHFTYIFFFKNIQNDALSLRV